jgi:hypothetical protein
MYQLNQSYGSNSSSISSDYSYWGNQTSCPSPNNSSNCYFNWYASYYNSNYNYNSSSPNSLCNSYETYWPNTSSCLNNSNNAFIYANTTTNSYDYDQSTCSSVYQGDFNCQEKIQLEVKSNPSTSYKVKDQQLRKNQLPDKAVDILNEWFDDHIRNPYPTLEEKERLARMGDISVKQVNAW